MKLSRRVSWFLLAFGVWSWVVWVTFARNLWKDASGLAFDDGGPTGYFWVHLLLVVVSFTLGTAIGLIGLGGLRGSRPAPGGTGSEPETETRTQTRTRTGQETRTEPDTTSAPV